MSARILEFPPSGVSDTSRAAAESLPSRGADLRARVLGYIVGRGQDGATCWEIERSLAFIHQTASPRIWELRLAGRVADSGQRRMTGSGRQAVVWVALPEGAAPVAAAAARKVVPRRPAVLVQVPVDPYRGPGKKCCFYHILGGELVACGKSTP